MTTEQHDSKTEGRGDVLARQERMAELGREIAECDSDMRTYSLGSKSYCDAHDRRIAAIAELSRLRNEGGGEELPPNFGQGDHPLVKALNGFAPSDLPAREAIEWAREIYGSLEEDRNSAARDRNIHLIAAALQPLSQGNGEAVGAPVAWQYESPQNPGHWTNLSNKSDAEYIEKHCKLKVRPLYVAPSSQPEGVREALSKVIDSFGGKLHSEKIDAVLAVVSPIPSPGLVEAAEWPRSGIYIASKCKHADRWRLLRDKIGLPIKSTWIDEAGEGETSDFADLWRRNISEACSAEVLIINRERDEVLKGAWIEMGAALACGVPVYAVGIEEFTIAKANGVTHFRHIRDAVDAAKKLVFRISAKGGAG